jgi:hypothetical protein
MIKTGKLIDINMLHLIFVPAKSRTSAAACHDADARFFASDYFFTLDSIIFFGLFSKLVANAQRRSDGPGANVNLRNLWLNPVLNAVLRVSIVSPLRF